MAVRSKMYYRHGTGAAAGQRVLKGVVDLEVEGLEKGRRQDGEDGHAHGDAQPCDDEVGRDGVGRFGDHITGR